MFVLLLQLLYICARHCSSWNNITVSSDMFTLLVLDEINDMLCYVMLNANSDVGRKSNVNPFRLESGSEG
jgi:hypothetical protein